MFSTHLFQFFSFICHPSTCISQETTAVVQSNASTLQSILSCCPDISDNTWMGGDDKELTPTLQLGVGSGTCHPSFGAGVWFISDIVLADGVSVMVTVCLNSCDYSYTCHTFSCCVSSDHAGEFWFAKTSLCLYYCQIFWIKYERWQMERRYAETIGSDMIFIYVEMSGVTIAHVAFSSLVF